MFIGLVLKHWRLIAGVLIALALVGAIHIHGYRSGAAGVQQKWDAERARQTAAALKASEEARAEEQRRIAAQQEIQDAYDAQLTAYRRDATAARAASDSLRLRLATFTAEAHRASGNPATSGERAATGIDVLADLLREVEAEGRAMAEEADRSRISGAQCQRSYESLTPVSGER